MIVGDLPKEFPGGTELTAAVLDRILAELWRWRRLRGTPPLHVANADSTEDPRIRYLGSDQVAVGKNKTGGTIGAGSLTAPVKFTLTFQVPDNVGGPALVDGDTIDCYNAYAGTIADGAIVFPVALYGYWYVLTSGCP